MSVRKAVKATLWALLGIFLLAIATVGVVLGVLFSPQKLTPVANRVMDSLFVVPHQLDKIELTLKETFPLLGLEIEGLSIRDTMANSPFDEFLSVPSIILQVDTKQLVLDHEIDITGIILNDASANLFIGRDNRGNYEFVRPFDDKVKKTDVELPFTIDLNSLKTSNLQLSLVVDTAGIDLSGLHIDLEAEGDMDRDVFPVNLSVESLICDWKDMHLETQGHASIDDTISLSLPELNVSLGKLGFSGKVNSLSFLPANGGMRADAEMNFRDWDYNDILDVFKSDLWSFMPTLQKSIAGIPVSIPPQIEISTKLDGDIRVDGLLAPDSFPKADVSLWVKDLEGNYGDVPYRLKNASVTLGGHLDLNKSHDSYLDIKEIKGSVSSSYYPELEDANCFKARGRLYDIFPQGTLDKIDPLVKFHLDLKADAREANPYVKPALDSCARVIPKVIHDILHGLAPSSEAAARLREAMADGSMYTDNSEVSGKVNLDFTTSGVRLSTWTSLDIDNTEGRILVDVEDVNAKIMDGYTARLDGLHLDMKAPIPDSISVKVKQLRKDPGDKTQKDFAYVLKMDDISVLTPEMNVKIPGGDMSIMEVYYPGGESLARNGVYTFHFNGLEMTTGDGDGYEVEHPFGRVEYNPSGRAVRLDNWDYKLGMDNVRYKYLGHTYTSIQSIRVDLHESEKDKSEGTNYVLKWNPVVQLDMKGLKNDSEYGGSKIYLNMPHLNITVKDQVARINESRIQVDNSDFSLTGELRQFGKWWDKSDKLKGHLVFKSNMTNVDELIGMAAGVNVYLNDLGFVANKDTLSTRPEVQKDTVSNPLELCIPTDVDLALEASIDKARILNQDARNVQANVYVHDGELLLSDAEFDCEAAKMHMSASLYAPVGPDGGAVDSSSLSFNFKMDDIDIKKAIDIIPQVDSLMPMLRTFSGKVNLELAFKSSYDSLQQIIPSSQLAALSLDGKDLVVVPSDIYDKIAGFLLVKRDDNMIDSLSVEALLKDNSILVYPFKIALSKCLLAVDGTNELDPDGSLQGINYHISMIRPLPVGLDLGGSLNKVNFKLATPKYNMDFTPVRRYEAKQQGETIESDIDSAVQMILGLLSPSE